MNQIAINELKQHPRNNEFFDDITGDKWDEFLESVKARGVIEPIVITQDKTIVSGHQRVRACKELGITHVMCDIHIYDNEDQVLQDLIETNIRQRGSVGGSVKKIGLRIIELERLYGIKHGGHRSQHANNSSCKPQQYLASQMDIDVRTLQNYKKLTKMIPELEELVDTGIVSKTTALAIMNQLKPEEQEDFIKSMDITKKITQRQLDNYVSSRENQLNARVTELNEQIRQLNSTNSQLQNKLQYALKGQKEYEDLQAKIESLRQQKSEFLNRLNIVSEIGGLSADVQDMLEDKLAPIKFKQFIDVLHEEPVVKENLENIVHRVESWLDEMKKILGDSVVESVNIVEIMKGE